MRYAEGMGSGDTFSIQALLRPEVYDHPVSRLTVVETHVSWVILTGDYAYKIKKPVDLGFLNFSTLEKRRFYCEEELRLNRRLAPQLYLAVIAVTGDPRHPCLGGRGPALEYAVKMRQFDPAQQFDHLLENGRLPVEDIDRVARRVSVFHDQAAVATADTPFGSPAAVWRPVAKNHEQIRPLLEDAAVVTRLDALQDWFENQRRELAESFQRRKEQGFVRECHGDLHLANIARFEGEVVIFDCLEFNEHLRWIDVISDVAFLVMDLESRDQRSLAFRFLDDYLRHRSDYEGLSLLPYYLAYRAMVRAKVALIRSHQHGAGAAVRTAAQAEFRRYLELAESYTRPRQAALIITHGLSGSGKTTLTQLLLEGLGAIRVRSDVERKRLFGLDETARAAAAPGEALYHPAASERTYRRLAELAALIVEAGFPVIVDATFLKRDQREAFQALAKRLGVPFLILHCHAPLPLLCRWISERQAAGTDASDADLAVLEHQIATQEPLLPAERACTLDLDTARSVTAADLCRRVRDALAGGP